MTFSAEEVRVAVLKAIGGYLERNHPDNAISYIAKEPTHIDRIAMRALYEGLEPFTTKRIEG